MAADALSELGLDADADAAPARRDSRALAATPKRQGAAESSIPSRDQRRKAISHMDPQLVHAIYGDTNMSWADLPLRVLPRSKEELQSLQTQLMYEKYFVREWNYEDVDDLAFYHMHEMREKAVNVYANVRKAAEMIHQYEQDDYAMGENQTYFSSWARMEINLAKEYDEFNEGVRQNIMSMVRQPVEEELRDQLEAIGEAAMLPPSEAEREPPKFPSGDQVRQSMISEYLDGIFPGISTGSDDSLADDIYAGPEEGEGTDELFQIYEKEYKDGEEDPEES